MWKYLAKEFLLEQKCNIPIFSLLLQKAMYNVYWVQRKPRRNIFLGNCFFCMGTEICQIAIFKFRQIWKVHKIFAPVIVNKFWTWTSERLGQNSCIQLSTVFTTFYHICNLLPFQRLHPMVHLSLHLYSYLSCCLAFYIFIYIVAHIAKFNVQLIISQGHNSPEKK